MRRRAVLIVEYEKESGIPLSPEEWETTISSSNAYVSKVRVEVQSDEC